MRRPPIDVQPIILEGRFVRLEPAAEAHSKALAVHALPATFRYFSAPFPSAPTEAAMLLHIRELLASPSDLQFVIVLQSTGEPIGSSSYLDIRRDNLGLEIGRTWYAEEHRGSAVNPEAKLLMMTHAFEVLGCERVQLKTDLRNVHSQRAIEKLGAKNEGVLRRHVQMPDGYMRDSVMYSVVPEEWPAVKKGLEERLGR